MKRKITALFLILAMCLTLLAGCGSNDNPGGGNDNPGRGNQQVEKIKIYVPSSAKSDDTNQTEVELVCGQDAVGKEAW